MGYSPIYVGPVEREDAVRRAVEESAARHGRRVADAGRSSPGDVVLSSVEDLVAAPARFPGSPPWIVWGREAAERLPRGFRMALERGGLVVDPRENASACILTFPELARALANAATGDPESCFPLLVSAAQDATAEVAGEVQLRLESLGFDPVVLTECGEGAFREMPVADRRRPALVVRIDTDPSSERTADLVALGIRMRDQGAGLVMVGDARRLREIAEDGEWLRGLGSPRLVSTAAQDPAEAVVRAHWPPLRDLLVGAPAQAAEMAPVFEAPLRTRPLHEVLQVADAWRNDGFFLLFEPHRLGWISLSGDHVSGAARLGDPDGGSAPPEVSARVREMATWREGRAVLVSEGRPRERWTRGVRIPVAMVGLDVRRTLDELALGGAGSTALAPSPPLLPTHRVARELLRWGLPLEADRLLRAAERSGGCGVDEELLLAHLEVERNPPEAAARLHRMVMRMVGEGEGRTAVQIDATLSAFLLDLRDRRVHPAAVWTLMEQWLESAGDGWVSTSRHAAILHEFAVRAGQAASATRFRVRAFELAAPGDPLPALLRSPEIEGQPCRR